MQDATKVAERLSAAEARRVALSAQGFSGGRVARSQALNSTLEHLHVLQIDSVNVFARSHYLPFFSRTGRYDQSQLDDLLWHSGDFTEYWAHEAAFIRVEDRPLFGWRMTDFRQRYAERFASMHSELQRIRDELGARGSAFVRDLETAPRDRRGPWWDWSETKRAVEMLFATGEVVSVGRERFERKYALADQAIPTFASLAMSRREAQQRLIDRAARSLGVATLADLADYHRMRKREAAVAVQHLEESHDLLPVEVEGWNQPNGTPTRAWMHRDARLPNRVDTDALLTPFDPTTWFRPRTERIFDFYYRLEIYTPKEKRQYGYYCLPLMVGGKLAGRIDLKADRARRELLVQAAWQEPGAPKRTAEAAQRLLASAASWQGLDRVKSTGVGNLTLPMTFNPN